MTPLKKLTTLLLMTVPPVFVASCGGGGGGGDSVAAPSNLSYAASTALYLVGVPVDVNQPSVSGQTDSWSVSPALPAGLQLNGNNGRISGTPSAPVAPAEYTIRARNGGGSTATTVRIGVESPPRYAYAANGDNTVSSYTVDAATGELRHNGFLRSDIVELNAGLIVPQVDGRAVYTPNAGIIGAVGANISVYRPDERGRLVKANPAPVGNGPYDMALSADGAYAYVTAEADNDVHVYSAHPTTGELTTIQVTSDGNLPSSIAVDPLGRFAFVTYGTSQTVVSYDIDPATGMITRTQPELDVTPALPTQVVVDPAGEFAYVTDNQFNLLIQYAIDPTTGSLTQTNTRAVGGNPRHVAVHPTGRWIYLIRGNGTLRSYEIESDGSLTQVDNDVPAGTDPRRITFDPSGTHAYVANNGSDDVTHFEIDRATGALTEALGVATRIAPVGFVTLKGDTPVERQPQFLYTANETSATVTSYSIAADTGNLTAIAGPPVLTESSPTSISADPLGRFLYSLNAGAQSVSTYTIDSLTGALTPSGMALSLGGSPRSVAVGPNGLFLWIVDDVADSISAFSIDASTGEPTLVGTALTGGTEPEYVTPGPTGRFLYVSNHGSNTVTAVEVDWDDLLGGSLTVLGTSQITVNGDASKVRFSPSGDRAFATLPGFVDRAVSMSVGSSDGTLAILGSGNPTANEPVSIAVHPTGRFAFAAINDPASDGNVSAFSIDPATGVLSDVGDAFVGLNPIDLAVDPSGRFLYVANENGNDVSLFSINSTTGALTSAGAFSTDLRPLAITVTETIE